MRRGDQQYLYPPQQQQQQRHLQQQPQPQLQLNSGFTSLQQNHPFVPQHYSHLTALNGMPVLGALQPLGGGEVAAMSGGMHRGGGGGLHMQSGVLQQQQQWGQPGVQLRSETQAWSSGVFPSQQGLIQGNLVQQHTHVQQPQQQQLVYLQDLRSGSLGLNPPQDVRHGGDGLLDRRQHGRLGRGGGNSYGGDGLLGRRGGGNSHGFGRSHGNGNAHHSKPYDRNYDRNNRASGNWGHGGEGGGGGGGGPAFNSLFKGGRNDRGRGEDLNRSHGGSLRCEPCDRTFKNFQQYTAHNNTHIKCDWEGCSFEASGRVVKEHKQSIHDNAVLDVPVRSNPVYRSKESRDELSKWIEERRKNYPTNANIKHKAEEMRARRQRGELIDEDARKRKERLKEILAKQAELGVPVAEVPSYYMSDRYGSLKGKGGRGESSGSGPNDNPRNGKRAYDQGLNGVAKDENKEPPTKVPRISDASNVTAQPAVGSSKLEVEKNKEAQQTVEPKESLETEAVEPDAVTTDGNDQKPSNKNSEKVCFFYKRGRCKKGNRCEFLHERRPKKKRDDVSAQPATKKAPTLLEKLLDKDIRKEKSQILQALRFFVNNDFLREYPLKPLKFFESQEGEHSNGEVEVGRPDTEAQKMETNEGTVCDVQAQTSHGDANGEELPTLDGKPLLVQEEDLEDSDEDEFFEEPAMLAGEAPSVQDEIPKARAAQTSNVEVLLGQYDTREESDGDSEELTMLEGEAALLQDETLESDGDIDPFTMLEEDGPLVQDETLESDRYSEELPMLDGEVPLIDDETFEWSDADSEELTMLDGEAAIVQGVSLEASELEPLKLEPHAEGAPLVQDESLEASEVEGHRVEAPLVQDESPEAPEVESHEGEAPLLQDESPEVHEVEAHAGQAAFVQDGGLEVHEVEALQDGSVEVHEVEVRKVETSLVQQETLESDGDSDELEPLEGEVPFVENETLEVSDGGEAHEGEAGISFDEDMDTLHDEEWGSEDEFSDEVDF